VALIAITALAACSKGDNTTADTSTIPGVDTTKAGAVSTTDTVVRTTTTDTIQGKAPDTTKGASKTKGTKAKTP
jgi:hypothetical protein